MRRLTLFCLVALSLTGCMSRSYLAEQFRYTDDGRAKPRVAVMPVFDHSHSDLPWNLSEEFTEAIAGRFNQGDRFYITSDLDVLGRNLGTSSEVNPFIEDVNWINEVKSHSEFVVFIELAEHSLVPKSNENSMFSLPMTQSYSLDIALRVKVLDIRNESPRVILQELQHQTFHIPWRMTSIDYNKSGLSRAAFHISPIGMAHGQMVKRITKQIQEYILIAKSN